MRLPFVLHSRGSFLQASQARVAKTPSPEVARRSPGDDRAARIARHDFQRRRTAQLLAVSDRFSRRHKHPCPHSHWSARSIR